MVAARETRTRLDVEAEHGLTPMVGRERELGQLLDAFARAQSGEGQVVFVVGEPGIGKSRLLLELHRRIDVAAAWHEGHCLSFGKAMAFHPLVDLIRRWFGVEESDGEAAIAAKLERGVAELGADLGPVTPYLRSLLSVDPGDDGVRGMSPAERRGEIFEALRRLLVHAAERQPQILVIEDLHWIDSASEQFLATLVDSVPAVRAVLVFTYRPGYSNPFGDRSYFTRIVPAPLSADDSARMAAAVLDTEVLPAGLRALVATKAEGNPFYVEELVKSLEEGGALRRANGRLDLARPVAEIDIPTTIQDVIAARIDRLPEAPKRTLQLASVIGREFTRRLVDRLAGIRERTEDFLRELTALELIHERRRFPELAYMFKHALTQDVTYASLLVERRKELHGLIGRAIEELYADRLPEHFETLAHHFSRAENWERALDYLLKAAGKATQAFGLRQALELYTEALVVADRCREPVPATTLIAIHRARADLFFGIGDFVRSREAAETLVNLARRIGDRDRAAEAGALVQIATAWQWAEDFPAAFGRVREAIEIAEAVGAQAPLGLALYTRGYLHAVNGRLDAARPTSAAPSTSGGPWAIPIVRRSPCISSRCAGAGKESTGPVSSAETGSPDRTGASPGHSAAPGACGIRGWHATIWGTMTGHSRPSTRGWRSPRRSATTPTSHGFSTRSAGCASSVATMRGASSCRSNHTRSRSALPGPATAPAPNAARSSATIRPRPGWRRGTSPRQPRPWTRRITSSPIRRRRNG